MSERPMTPTQIVKALEKIGWSGRQLAMATGRPPQRGFDWTTGHFAIPDDVAEWLANTVAYFKENPPPKRRKPRAT